MSQFKKLAKNSFLFAIGSFGSRAITFLLLPVYTRYLTPGEYGIIDVLLTTILLLTPLLSVQAQEISFRYSMDESKDPKVTLMNSLLFCSVGFVFLLFFNPLLDNINVFSEYSTLFYLVLFFTMVDGVLKQFSRGIGKIKQFVTSDIIYSATFATLNIVFLVVLGLDINGYLLSMFIGYLLSSIFLYVFGGIRENFSLKGFDLSLIKPMLRFSVPLIPTAIMWWTMNVSDRYILSYFIDFEATGIYAISSKIPIILVTFNIVFFKAWQITAIEGYGQPDFRETFEKIFNTLSVLLFLLLSVIIVFLKPIFSFLATGDFYLGWQYVPFLLIGVLFSAYSGFWGVVYIASRKTFGALITSGFGAILNFVLNIILIPLIGIFGAAISTMISFFGVWLSRYFHVKHNEDIKLSFKNVFLNLSLVSLQIIILFKFSSLEFYLLNFMIFGGMLAINYSIIKNNFEFIKKIIINKIKK